MKITKIHIENFRALRSTDIDIEEKLSIIVGKNNTGKTSIKVLFDKFLTGDSTSFRLDDLNCDIQQSLSECIEADKGKTDKEILETGVPEFAIKMFLHIAYDENDNLSNISNAGLLADLDVTKAEVILGFSYHLSAEKYIDLLHTYQARTEKFEKIKQEKGALQVPNVLHLLKSGGMSHFFKNTIFVADPSDDANIVYKVPSAEVEKKKAVNRSDMQRIVQYEFIDAEREAINPNDKQKASSTLSALAANYWEIIERTQNNDEIINKRHELEAQFILADAELSTVYKDVFQTILDEITKLSDSKDKLKIESSFQARDLLRQNACVSYDHNAMSLPEDYNGLGYMNLIEIIFKLKLTRKRFEEFNEGNGADISLLFIEEPEAHMHPQMQVIFIKNIAELLSLKNGKIAQTLISTHSSHIAANTDMDAFKYFINTDDKGVQVKNLRALKPKGEIPQLTATSTDDEKVAAANKELEFTTYRFIKQYITLNRAEVFFADKIIIIEGDTERILFPSIMKKIDDAQANVAEYLPLLSQNISIIEAGAYAKEFDGLIKFLDIKTIIITDTDYLGADGKKASGNDARDTSNATIKFYMNGKSIEQIKAATEGDRLTDKILLAYQQNEADYWARSFEDAFIAINHEWLKSIANRMSERGAIQNKDKLLTGTDFYTIADECLKSKTAFAVSIIFESLRDGGVNWAIPKYIKEGLLWLSK